MSVEIVMPCGLDHSDRLFVYRRESAFCIAIAEQGDDKNVGAYIVVSHERLRAFAQAILDNYPEPSETRVIEV